MSLKETDQGFSLWSGPEDVAFAQDGLKHLEVSLLEPDKLHFPDRLLFYDFLLETCQAAVIGSKGECCWVETEFEAPDSVNGPINIGFSIEPNGNQAGLSRSLTQLQRDKAELGRLRSSGTAGHHLQTAQGRIRAGYQQIFKTAGLDTSEIVQIGPDKEALRRDRVMHGALEDGSGLTPDIRARRKSAMGDVDNGTGQAAGQVSKEKTLLPKRTIIGALVGILPVSLIMPAITAMAITDGLKLPDGQQSAQDVLSALNREQAVLVDQEPPFYIVSPGDTMWAISQTLGISLSELVAVNHQIKDPSLIRPGQRINIPANAEIPEQFSGVGGARTDENRLIGAVDADKVDLSEITQTNLKFVPVDFPIGIVDGYYLSWSAKEKKIFAAAANNAQTLLQEIFRSDVVATVPKAFCTNEMAQVNIIRPLFDWEHGGWEWGFNNQGPWGLAIIAPDISNARDLTEDEIYQGFGHELIHAYNLIPLIKEHPEYDFACTEGLAEAFSRLLVRKYLGESQYTYRYGLDKGREAYPTSPFRLTEEAVKDLSHSDKYDGTGLAFVWLIENQPGALAEIYKGWKSEFPDDSKVPFKKFAAWGDKGWVSDDKNQTLWKDFEEWWVSNPIFSVKRN